MRSIFILTIVLALLVGTNYLHAWTTAPNNPPGGNVAAPINTSNSLQVKTGPLGTGSLDVTGLQSITHNRPRLSFIDQNEKDFRIDVDFNEMRFQTDRNNDNTFGPSYGPTSADGLQSLVLHASSTSAGDYALFSNQIRASEYCDRGGNNCFLPSNVGGGGPGGGGVNLTAGNGITLTPNPITGAGTVAANTNQLQSRVTGTCPVGQAIRVVNTNGTVTCQPIATVSTVYSCPVVTSWNTSNGLESSCTGQLQLQPTCTYWTAGNSGSNSGGSNRANPVNCTRVGHLVP